MKYNFIFFIFVITKPSFVMSEDSLTTMATGSNEETVQQSLSTDEILIPGEEIVTEKNIKKEPTQILILGLDDAGKTTILYRFVKNETVPTIRTLGFNTEETTVDQKTLYFIDIGGHKTIKALWNFYLENTKAVIFVVDSANKERISEALLDFNRLLEKDELKDCPFLIYANKQDLPNALTVEEISTLMKLDEVKSHNVHVQAASAVNGNGLTSGLDRLCVQLKNEL